MSTQHSKGSFGRSPQRADLPLSKRYLVPGTRRSMLLGGLAVGVVAALLVWLDVERHGGDWLSGGPLSSAHATLETSCASCHGEAFGTISNGVADAGCSKCHEGAAGAIDDADGVVPALFSVESHAVLRTAEGEPRELDVQPSCAGCHGEHEGREAPLVHVADRQCLTCHQGHRFDRDHPDFAFTEAPDSDEDALHFSHGQHVKEILKRTRWDDAERTCLRCHQPTDDVRGFAAIDFDRHCSDCHLGSGVATARLPLDDGRAMDGPGVWSLERIRRSGLPATDWSFTTSPRDFRGGSRVVKLRLDHEDPWILFNLRRLRQLRYGDAGVADLLVTAPSPAGRARGADERAYEQAVASLEAQAAALRGSSDPAVQSDLAWIEDELARVRRELDEGRAELAGVHLPDGSPAAFDRPQEWLAAWDELVADLSAQCSTCHRMERATILEVEDDQRTLTRAEFDHGPHVTGSPAAGRGCLHCHGRLPVMEAVAAADADVVKALQAQDRAAIHNLPGIATCRECHGSATIARGSVARGWFARHRVASACVDCHSFHPDAAARRARRLAHLGEADLRESSSGGPGGGR